MIKKALIGLGTLLAIVVAVGLFTPKTYSIEETIVIQAPSEQVHAYVGELRQWEHWTTWDAEDPSIVKTFGEQSTGVGAYSSWTSDHGDGELTFTLCDPDEGIAYDMTFISGDARVPAQAAIRYRPVDGGTEVTWTMAGSWKGAMPPVMDGWMKLLSPMMIGGQFEKALMNLKQVVEDAAAAEAGA